MTTTSRIQAVYDQIAEEFASITANMPPELAVDADRFLDLAGQGAHVLELGCGAGRDMAWLESRGATVVGSDLSAGMLAQARRQARGSLVQLDMRHLALQTGCFQGVWCCAALLHLSKADAPRTLAEVRRVLGPEGALFLAVQEGVGEGWEHTTRYSKNVERFFARYNVKEISALLASSGFTIRMHTSNSAGSRRWLRFLCTTTALDT
ncbi:MAG: methyltransferase domain-containing protein [Anaerolineae bacterium]|nr:methyltransferase domain-containing protein [Anaerolineae bacterium]